MDAPRLKLPEIASSLRDVQENFALINQSLTVPRDAMTDEVRANMMAGYRFVDDALAKGLDFFQAGRSECLLELNTLVLCGDDAEKRRDFAKHISATKKQFYENAEGGIGALMEWLDRHKGNDVWRRAAGAYVHVLSRPQLYIEGNHRTGALIMSYMLAREGKPPFVLSVENAKAYFDPSTLVKDTKKHSIEMLIRLPKLKKRFAKLLRENGNRRFLTLPS